MNTKKLVLLLALAGLSSTQAVSVKCFNDYTDSINWLPELDDDQLLSENRFFRITVNNNILFYAPLTKMLTTFFTAKENSVKTVASHTFHSFVKTFVSLALLYLAERSENQIITFQLANRTTATLKGKAVILSYLLPVALRIFATLNYIAGQTNTSYAELFKAIRKLSLKDFADDKSLANILRQSVNILLPLYFTLEYNNHSDNKFGFFNNFCTAFISRHTEQSDYASARNLVQKLPPASSEKPSDNKAIESLKKLFSISAKTTSDTRSLFKALVDALRLCSDDTSFYNVREFIRIKINARTGSFTNDLREHIEKEGWLALKALFNLKS